MFVIVAGVAGLTVCAPLVAGLLFVAWAMRIIDDAGQESR